MDGNDHRDQNRLTPGKGTRVVDVRRHRLRPFDSSAAVAVASWIQGEKELKFVAPYTAPPISPEKVLEWRTGRQTPFLFEDVEGRPVAYGELVRSQSEMNEMWIAHVVVDPRHRGGGIGQGFTRALADRAFDGYRASRVMLSVLDDNLLAEQCYRRCGFMECGHRRIQFDYCSQSCLLVDMRLERFDWSARRWKDRLAEECAGADFAGVYRRYCKMRHSSNPHLRDAINVALEKAALDGEDSFVAMDLGSGPGVAAEAIARRFPRSTVLALDADPLALLIGEKALGECLDGRVEFAPADLRYGRWRHGREQSCRLAVSVLASHWMSRRSVREFYGAIHGVLMHRGVFVNADHIGRDGLTGGFGGMLLRWLRPRSPRASRSAKWEEFWSDVKAELGVTGLCAAMADDFDVYEGNEEGQPLGFHLSALSKAEFSKAEEIWRRKDDAVLWARA